MTMNVVTLFLFPFFFTCEFCEVWSYSLCGHSTCLYSFTSGVRQSFIDDVGVSRGVFDNHVFQSFVCVKRRRNSYDAILPITRKIASDRLGPDPRKPSVHTFSVSHKTYYERVPAQGRYRTSMDRILNIAEVVSLFSQYIANLQC